MLGPVIMSQLGQGPEVAKHQALKHLNLTHESRKLAGFAEVRVAEGKGDVQRGRTLAQQRRLRICEARREEWQVWGGKRLILNYEM